MLKVTLLCFGWVGTNTFRPHWALIRPPALQIYMLIHAPRSSRGVPCGPVGLAVGRSRARRHPLPSSWRSPCKSAGQRRATGKWPQSSRPRWPARPQTQATHGWLRSFRPSMADCVSAPVLCVELPAVMACMWYDGNQHNLVKQTLFPNHRICSKMCSRITIVSK